MTAATMICERCTKVIPADSVGYSNAGNLLCPSCLDAAGINEAEARGATSLRNAKIALGVTVALLIIVPVALFAAGLGKMLGHALMVLGAFVAAVGMCTYVPARRFRAVPIYKRLWFVLMLVGFVVCIVGIPLRYQKPDIQWTSFSCPDGDCAIRFPGSPTESTTPAADGGDPRPTFTARWGSGQYSLSYWKRPKHTDVSTDLIFDDEENDIIHQTGASRGRRTRIWVSKIPGRAISFRAKGKDVQVHMFATKARVYQLIASVPHSELEDGGSADFLNSFALSPEKSRE